MLKIGDFSRLARISVRMLRHYDEIGLLAPSETDCFTGYRYYDESQLAIAYRITALRDMGFGLAAIGEMLKVYGDPEAMDMYMADMEMQLKMQIADTERRLKLIADARKQLREECNMNYTVEVKTLPERYAACVRMTLPQYEAEGEMWRILREETAALNVVPAEPCVRCAVFMDCEYKDADVDVEIQMTVNGQYPDTEHVRFKTLPEITFASCILSGGYEHLSGVYAAIIEWVGANGYECVGPVFNIYRVGPAETRNPDEYVTEVCYAISKK